MNLDFLFLQYMHIIRAENNDSDTTTPSLLDFFTKESKGNSKKKVTYGYRDKWLYKDETMSFITLLTNFWLKPQDYLQDKSLLYMDVLFLFQNSSWKSFVSCLVWKNKEQFICESIDKNVISNAFEAPLLELLKMMSLLLINDQANTNKTDHIAFKLNVDLLHNKPLSSEIVKVSYPDEESFFDDLKTANSRRVKYLLYLYAHIYGDFSNPIDVSKLQIEHILPKEWQNACFDGWDENSHAEYLEKIGNKILLDSKRNIKCANNFFAKKKEIYKESSDNLNLKEVKDLAAKEEKNAWYKEDIDKRGEEIYKGLKNFVMSQNPA